jgi:hypothetical protein
VVTVDDGTAARLDDVERQACADEQRRILAERCERLLKRWAAEDAHDVGDRSASAHGER